ncbi:MAG: A/G-specific adenine glycosylase [Chloroflexi bacterium]|nr:A/G-specific adenine glycosylase [Chloroflexota bacterium]
MPSPRGTTHSLKKPEERGTRLQDNLLAWYAAHARDLPWRRTRDPYRTLVAEVMLQQTGVGRVLPKYEQFLQRFPTLEALASAPVAEVIRTWAPLGYNRRAVYLSRAAIAVIEKHGGAIPQEPELLRRLPGIGPYTASAIACFAFGQDEPVVDTNIRRVLVRLLLGARDPRTVSAREVTGLARQVLPRGRAAEWSQALMDIGAGLCARDRPSCSLCPARPRCAAAPSFLKQPPAPRRVAESRPYYGSPRYFRGRIVEALRSREAVQGLTMAALGPHIKEGYAVEDEPWLLDLLKGLARDGLVRLAAERVVLP